MISSDGQFETRNLPASSDGWTIVYVINIPEQLGNNISLEVKANIKRGELSLKSNIDSIPKDVTLKSVKEKWILQERKSWSESNLECIKNNGNLLSIHSAEENRRIFESYRGYNGWIGVNTTTEMGKKTWRWTDGSKLNFTNWKGGKPTDSHSRLQCAFIKSSDKVSRKFS